MGYNPTPKPSPAFLLLAFLTVGYIIPGLRAAKGSHWTYQSRTYDQGSPTSDWNQGLCKDGKSQSPIDIDQNYASLPIHSTIDWKESRKNYDFNEFEIVNNGHSVMLQGLQPLTGMESTFTWPARNNSVYKLAQIHFHWGFSDKEGSEHIVGGKSYSMEMHMVHYRKSGGAEGGFGSILDAVKSGTKDALSVVGIFFQGDDSQPTSALEPVFSNLCKVPNVEDKGTVGEVELKLSEILKLKTQAVTYMGSLTTPGCLEIVAWLVVPEPEKINKDILNQMRVLVLEAGVPLKKNYRHVQAVNNRSQGIVEFQQ